MDSKFEISAEWLQSKYFVRGGIGEDDPPAEDPPVADDPPADPPAATPQYITADEYKAQQAIITGTLDAIKESLQALNSSRVHEVPRHETPIEGASDEELEAALASGSGAKVFRKAIASEVEKIRREFGARAEVLENTAGGSLSNMAMQMAKPQMKHYSKPYVKEAVDKYVAQMPANQRLHPENYLVVYNAVVGQFHDTIVAEEVEAALRKAKTGSGVVPGGSNGRANNSPTTPVIKEVFGEEAERELRSRNRTIESIARAFGMTADEYIKAANGEGEGNVH